MIEAFLTLMKSDDKRHQMPFNLGNTTEISIRELAEIIKKKTGSASPIIYLDPVSDDPKQRCPDIARVKHELGWFPKISLSEGLDKTIAFFRKKLPTLASGDGSEQAQAFSDLSFEGSIRQERDERP